MFYGVSHLDVPVTDLKLAEAIYATAMGFPVQKYGEGYLDVAAGTVLVRLLQTDRVARPATVRVQCGDVEAGLAKLQQCGASLLYEPMRTDDLELVASVTDPDGNTIMLWRELTEDEWGFTPELPKHMTWQPDADALLKSLLKSVPALFRGLARRKVSKNAEWLARETNRVTSDNVVRAYILSSAKPTRFRVIEPLKKHGYDPQHYQAEFEA